MIIKTLYPWSKESGAIKTALRNAIHDGCPDCRKLHNAIMKRSAMLGLCMGLMFGVSFSCPLVLVVLFGFGNVAAYYSGAAIIASLVLMTMAWSQSGRWLFHGMDTKWAESVINKALGNGAEGYYVRIINHKWSAEYQEIALSGDVRLPAPPAR